MKTYLQEMEHAASMLVSLIWAEHKEAEKAESQLRTLEAATRQGYDRAEWIILNDFDDDGLGTMGYWDTYFGPDKDRFAKENEVGLLEATRDSRAFSRSALAASLLQYGKQGISLVHAGLAPAPVGRMVKGVELKTLVWQGRNQALHWEEGRFSKATTACFEILQASDPGAFSEFDKHNKAFEIVFALGWNTFGEFEADMLSLA